MTRLTGYAGLTALIGSRVYPLKMPQKPTLPAVSYQRIDGPRESAIASDMGMAHPRMQVDCWASTYAGVKAVATQVRAALQRWSDAAASPVVLDSLLESDQDLYEAEVEIYRVSMDFIIWHRE